jgi:hypothetical protein
MTAISGHVCLELYRKKYLIQFYPFPNETFKSVYNNIGYTQDILPPFKSYPNETRRNLIIKITDVSMIFDYFFLRPQLGEPNKLNECSKLKNEGNYCMCNGECVACVDKNFGLPVEVEKSTVHSNQNCKKEPYSKMLFSEYTYYDGGFRDLHIDHSEIHMNNYFPHFSYELSDINDNIELVIQLKDEYALLSNNLMFNLTYNLKIFSICNKNETKTEKMFNLVFENDLLEINKTLKLVNLNRGIYFIELISKVNTTICEANYCPYKRTGGEEIYCESCGKQIVYLNAHLAEKNKFKEECLRMKNFIDFNNLFNLTRKYNLNSQNEHFLVNSQFQFINPQDSSINSFDINCVHLPKLVQIKSQSIKESQFISIQSQSKIMIASGICGLVTIGVIILILITRNNKDSKLQNDFYVFYPSIYASKETNNEVIEFLNRKLNKLKVNIKFLRDEIFCVYLKIKKSILYS